jgi:hypothetical protein
MLGGLALKNTHTRRCTREEFDLFSSEIRSKLVGHVMDTAIPLFFKSKDSFGDIDLICCVDKDSNTNIGDLITKLFSPNEIFHNGNCWSFDYKEIQVDFIKTSPDDFYTNQMYLSYNDLGNFIGRLAQSFGLKYGQEGLWYKHKFKGSYIGSISISKDYDRIYNFFDLDFSKWEKGFDSLEEIFEFIYQSKFFNQDNFQLSQLNKINRDRNAKRKSYMSFLEWMDKQPKKEYTFDTVENYVDVIDKAFPEANLIENIRRLEYEYCKGLYIKSKFNGGEVMRRFGLQGKELGDSLNDFKEQITYKYALTYDTFEEYILGAPKQIIYNDFEEMLNNKL